MNPLELPDLQSVAPPAPLNQDEFSVPSTFKQEDILLRLRESRAGAQSCTQAIAQLETILDEVTDIRRKYEEQMSFYQSRINCIDKLPLGVLTYLIELVERTSPFYMPLDKENGKRTSILTSMVLASVCKSWRSAALSLSSIWTYIRLILSEGSSPDSDTNFLNLYLERSGSKDIRLQITVLPLDEPSQNLALRAEQLLHVAAGQSERWAQIDFTLPASSFTAVFPIPSLPRLRSVSLNIPEAEDLLLVGEAPLLYFVGLCDLTFNSLCEDSLPWNHMTCLELYGATVAIPSANTLRCMPNLETYRCLEVAFAEPERPSTGNVVLPHLKVMDAEGSVDSDTVSWVDHISAPSLTRLCLPVSAHVESIQGFIISCQNLEYLSMMMPPGSNELRFRFLPSPSPVESLELKIHLQPKLWKFRL